MGISKILLVWYDDKKNSTYKDDHNKYDNKDQHKDDQEKDFTKQPPIQPEKERNNIILHFLLLSAHLKMLSGLPNAGS